MPYSSRRSFGGRQRAYHARPSNKKRQPKKDYIHPSRFIKPARPIQDVVSYEPQHTFEDFAMDKLLKANLQKKGFTAPSPIQDQAVPVGLDGNDIIGIANTGTGKTIAFALPVLHALLSEPDAKALIIAPTRELAQQIEEECRSVAKGSGLYGALLIGGSAMGPQLRDLRARPSIVIGTPGRIKDHLERGTLDLSSFNKIVLDEVDRMLDMGFINDVRSILSGLSAERQSFFFSATLDNRVKTLIESFLQNPVTISVKTGETSDNVEQDIVSYVSKSEKLEKLHDLLVGESIGKALIFDDTQRSVEQLSNELIGRGFMADAIHGGKSQSQRQRALKRFKSSNITVLVATDVAARGIDVSDITHVINYSTPQSYEDYVHRIGRAGRAGRTGFALTFIEQ